MRRLLRVILITVGIGLMLYPWISNVLYEKEKGSEIKVYNKKIENMTEEQYSDMIRDAQEYNQVLASSKVVLTDPFCGQIKESIINHSYDQLFGVGKNEMIAQIEIPCIKIKLPVYKGTTNIVLEKGIGHLEGTSIPVGGNDTHSVLTGHTGLNAAKLFTDLVKVEKGDLFYIHFLNRHLAYRVDKIQVVLPEDTNSLKILKDKDYVTLVTCTPYGINSHRLLVRGIRTKYIEKEYKEACGKRKKSVWMKEYKKALIVGGIIAVLLFVFARIIRKKGNKRKCERKSVVLS